MAYVKAPVRAINGGKAQGPLSKDSVIISGLQEECKMLENSMVLEADAYWDKVYSKADHWEDDRGYETVEEYGDDRDILYKAVAHWLDVDDEDADRDRLDEVYGMMNRDKKKQIVEDYIEYHDLQNDFNDWYNDKFCD